VAGHPPTPDQDPEGFPARLLPHQALPVLRWFRQAAPLHVLAADAGLSLSTADRYLHEGISVLAEHAPDLHEVLERGRREDWSPISLDGTLIQTDRVSAPARAAMTRGTAADTSSTAGTSRSVGPRWSPAGPDRATGPPVEHPGLV
jgi:hypothetical protein